MIKLTIKDSPHPVLVNPSHIQAVFNNQAGYGGSVVCLVNTSCFVKESIDEIEILILASQASDTK